jgi:hypothetical protein
MAESSTGIVVTEGMLSEAARAGYLTSLTIWAKLGVRVRTAAPLCVAVEDGFRDVLRCLVRELGGDVIRKMSSRETPLIVAFRRNNVGMMLCFVELGADVNKTVHGKMPLIIAATTGRTAVVRCLIQLGADVEAMNAQGNTAFFISARFSFCATMQCLLEDAGANMNDEKHNGETVWDVLIRHLIDVERGDFWEMNPATQAAALLSFLRVLVLRGAPPSALVALLSPKPARVVQEGARLRAQLPAYLVQRRALLDSCCCPRSGPRCTAIWSSPLPRSSGPRVWGKPREADDSLFRIRWVVAEGADVKERDPAGFTTFLWAAYNGYIPIMH